MEAGSLLDRRRHRLRADGCSGALRRGAGVQRGARASPPRSRRCTRRSTGSGSRTRSSWSTTPARTGRRTSVERARRPARARAAQPGEPRQGRVAAARDARGRRRAAAALRRRLRRRRCPRSPRMLELAGALRRRGRLAARARAPTSGAASPCGGGSPGRSFGLLCRAVLREPTRDLFCGFKLWRAPAAEAAYRATGADGLDVRRRDARDGARARLQHHRDRDPVDRPRGLAALDAAGDRAGHARAARGARGACGASRGRGRAAAPAELAEAAEPRRVSGRGRAGWTAVEAGALAALAALALAVLGGLVLKVWLRGGVVTGSDGFLVADPLQYLDWARQAGEHGLIGNRHDLAPGDRAFLHPGLLLSGRRVAAGRRPGASPTCCGSRSRSACCSPGRSALVRRFLARRDDRRLALVLALFACSPVAALVGWGGIGGRRRQAPGRLRHGRAVGGLVPVGLPVHGDRGRAAAARAARLRARTGRRRRRGWRSRRRAGCCARGCSRGRARRSRSCSPARSWCVAPRRGRRAWRRGARARAARSRRPPRRSSTTRCSAATTPSWALAARGQRPAALVVVGAGSPGSRRSRCPAAFAYRLPAPDFGAVALRAWPLAALLVYFQPFGTFPFHALPGPDAAARRARRARAAGAGSASARSGSGPRSAAVVAARRSSAPPTASRASPTPSTSAASRSR